MGPLGTLRLIVPVVVLIDAAAARAGLPIGRCASPQSSPEPLRGSLVHAKVGRLTGEMWNRWRRRMSKADVRRGEEDWQWTLALGYSAALLQVLELRGLVVTEAQRVHIRWPRSPEVLSRWMKRAMTATSVAEVLRADKPAS